MDGKLQIIWDSIKKDLALPENLDLVRLEKQLQIFSDWVSNDALGFVEACTGFGKTMEAFIAIKRMNLIKPNYNTIVILPNTLLYKDWVDEDYGYIKVHKLRNVKPYVVNTYTMTDTDRNCNLLIVDEAHRYANNESKYFSTVIDSSNYNFCLALSGSLTNDQREFLTTANVPRIAEVTQKEAEINGWVSKSIVYNFGIELDEDTKEKVDNITAIHNSNFKKFNHDFNTARGCGVGKDKIYTAYKKGMPPIRLNGNQWRTKVAKENGWDGSENHPWNPKNIYTYASRWNWSINERQKILYNYYKKIDITKDILLKLNETSIVFSESIDFIEKIKDSIGNDAECYHSKLGTLIYENDKLEKVIAKSCDKKGVYEMIDSGDYLSYKDIKLIYPERFRLSADKRKDKIKTDYKNSTFKYLLTVHSVDEGFDFDKIIVGITASAKGTVRVRIQRDGRVIRDDGNDKTAILINLYCKDSQEEKWLASRQRGMAKSKINWIKDINEIKKEKEFNEDDIIISND